MKYFKKYPYIIALILPTVACYWFFMPILNADQMLLDDLTGSVSGRVKSVAICNVVSNEIPQVCTPMNDVAQNNFVSDVHQAKKTLPLSHPKIINTYFIKVISTDGGGTIERKKCFLVSEIEGVKDLYFSTINTGENCSNRTFEYLEGGVATFNFLNAPASARDVSPRRSE